MRLIYTIPYFLFYIMLASCQKSPTEYATNWTNTIKSKIAEDVASTPDKMILDTARNELTLWLKGKKLKYFYLRPSFDSLNKIISFDTAASIYFSTDQKFELVKEYCPLSDRSFEGLRNTGSWIGLLEYRFCNGKIKNRNFNFRKDVGPEYEYDSLGNLVNTIKHGHDALLYDLRSIKYYR